MGRGGSGEGGGGRQREGNGSGVEGWRSGVGWVGEILGINRAGEGQQ